VFSEKTRTIVLFTLGLSDSPLSIDDIVFRTGFGYNTVKRVVFNDPRIRKVAGRPAKFHAQVPKADTDGLFVVEYEQPEQGWEKWLEEIRPLLPSIVAMSSKMSTQEKRRKITMFKSLGASFLSLAKDMEKENE
jgi:hypothetical protein